MECDVEKCSSGLSHNRLDMMMHKNRLRKNATKQVKAMHGANSYRINMDKEWKTPIIPPTVRNPNPYRSNADKESMTPIKPPTGKNLHDANPHRSNMDKESMTPMKPPTGPPKETITQTIPSSTCADCHKDLDDSLLAETKCGHFFHILCLLTLLQKTDKCPSCHEPISAANGWKARHIPCDKTIEKGELVWNDVHHLWMHKGCRFSVIELRHLTLPQLMPSDDNSPGPSKSQVDHLDHELPKFNNRSNVDSRGTSEKMKLDPAIILLYSFDSSVINELIGTCERMTLKPVIPEPDRFDKISMSLNTFDSDFFNESFTVEHRPLFESTDELNLPRENSEISGDKNEDICKFCDERFDRSHKPTTVTICGHLLHTHCMNRYLPTEKKCPICEHPINWVDVTNKCVFCLEPFNWNGDMYINLPCAHQSHQNCHKLWMCTTNDCPICKETIYSRDGCSVCSKPVLPSQIKRKSECGHEYHAKCSSSKITESNCPTCIKISEATSVTCTICFEQIKNDTKSKPISCKHEFHNFCLDRWLEHKTSCPLCRTSIA